MCCLVVVLARSMEAVEAFATMEAFVEHHLEATNERWRTNRQGFSSLEKSAAGRFFAKLPRSLSVELGLVSRESRKQARVPGPGHGATQEGLERQGATPYFYKKGQRPSYGTIERFFPDTYSE